MQVIEFDIDKKNLLGDIISKQTGSLNKAIKELFQNSFDARSTEIRVTMNSEGLRFIDNGTGMNKDDIHKYFRVFGANQKRNDKTKIGKFAMGRGQIFNFGNILWRTQNYAMVVDIKKNLNYTLIETNKFIEGTDIIISFYDKLYTWKVSQALDGIKRDIVPPDGINIFIDNKFYNPPINAFKNFSTDDYFVFKSHWHYSKIYNGGLSVISMKDSNYSYSIMPYEILDLNFARNELIETSESTIKLNRFINNIEEIMASEKDVFDIDEAKNVLKMLSEKRIKLSSVYDKRIIPLSNDKLVSFKELVEDPSMGIVYGDKDIWSDDCLRQDYKVISKDITNLFDRIISVFSLDIDFMEKTTRELSRKGFYKEIDLDKLTRNKMYFYIAVELNEYIFTRLLEEKEKKLRKIRLGLSDIAQAWTKPLYNTIWITKHYIQSIQNKEEAIIRLWETLCHEYAHTEENTKRDYHNWQFYENFEQNIKLTTKLLASAFKYITRKYIKEKYGY